MKIKSIEKIETKPVYDISVKDVEHYILENGIITHNSGVRYANSLTVFLSKSKEKEGDTVVGAHIRCTLQKGRLTKEQTKIEVKLYNDSRGLDRYFGLLELAKKYDIATKSKAKAEGKGEKWSIGGQVASEKVIYANPQKYFTEEVMKELEVVAGKEFKYGNNIVIPENDEDEETTEE